MRADAHIDPGGRLGPYEILGSIGSGGMGHVYRARDPRLGREVAVKVLPAAASRDAERLARFEQEARAAGALSHPNILVVFDVGVQDGTPFVVSELLEGETLRARIRRGPIPSGRATEWAVQIAHGLAAAHEKGIVHRDLKPENLFITRDGRLKILDFGLAKLEDVGPADQQGTGPLLTLAVPSTSSTALLGTAAYISPEQIKGEPADARSDIFAFGVVVYEMLCGVSPFKRDTSVESLHAVMKDEPPWPSEISAAASPELERVVMRCLEKDPDRRFQAAQDLGFHLEALSGSTLTAAGWRGPLHPGRRARPGLVLAAAVLAALVAASVVAYLAGRRVERPAPSFQPLTFRRGTVHNARFAPDGDTVVYSAGWEGERVTLFSARPGSPESRALDPTAANIMSISAKGEMALLVLDGRTFARGTLARAPLAGGAPREVLEDVEWADWTPDGSDLAVVRSGQKKRLEFPIGRTLYETTGWISHPRVSPDGQRVAFIDHPVPGDNRGSVELAEADGTRRTLAGGWKAIWGLAWEPRGEEVWFTASEREASRVLWAVDLRGRRRVVVQVPLRLTLHDLSRDGRRGLLGGDSLRRSTMGMTPGATSERDLSWLDYSNAKDISPDGAFLLFSEDGEAGGPSYSVYLRRMDGSPAVRLGDGKAVSLSPDGQWALAVRIAEQPQTLVALPTAAGQARDLPRGQLERYDWAAFLPDNRRIVIAGAAPGEPPRLFLQDIEGGPPRPMGTHSVSAGLTGLAVAPDGLGVAGTGADQQLMRFGLDGSAVPIPGGLPGEMPIVWTSDGRSLYVFRPGDMPARVVRLDVATGRREPWKDLLPADPSGVLGITRVRMTPDARAYVYTFSRILSDLYLAEGLK